MRVRIGSARKAFQFVILLALGVTSYHVQSAEVRAQTSQASAKDKPYVVEYYYKVRWGSQAEFLRLFKKNHYPVLKKEMELGRILQVKGEAPREHDTEEGRWDYRVTIVWKNVQVTDDDFDSGPIVKQLYPDQETFTKEEQRRFEILVAHWDLPVRPVNLDEK